MTTSLSDIKPGDKVIVRCSSPFFLDCVEIVDRVTKTQIIIGTRRFSISGGRDLGNRDPWFHRWIAPATPDEIAEVERQQQNKKDQERACQLVKEIDAQVSALDSPNAAAAIPHLEAALAALNTHPANYHD